ncbi:MAG: hypothetical protein ACJ739_02860 [Acidimicrobiales bacterium]
MTWRALFGLVLGAAVAALGALILGEYEFTGSLPWIAGPLFGLVVGEVVASVGRSRHVAVAAASAGLAFAGIAWAGWIDSTEGIEPVKALAWVAALLAAAAAFLRVAGVAALRRADRG